MGQETAKRVLDRDDLMTRCLGNADFAKRILGKYQERCAEDLVHLEQAVSSGDTTTVATLAHRIKGASANASAPAMRAAASEIEEAARRGSLEQVPDVLKSLQDEWTQLQAEIGQLV